MCLVLCTIIFLAYLWDTEVGAKVAAAVVKEEIGSTAGRWLRKPQWQYRPFLRVGKLKLDESAPKGVNILPFSYSPTEPSWWGAYRIFYLLCLSELFFKLALAGSLFTLLDMVFGISKASGTGFTFQILRISFFVVFFVIIFDNDPFLSRQFAIRTYNQVMFGELA